MDSWSDMEHCGWYETMWVIGDSLRWYRMISIMQEWYGSCESDKMWYKMVRFKITWGCHALLKCLMQVTPFTTQAFQLLSLRVTYGNTSQQQMGCHFRSLSSSYDTMLFYCKRCVRNAYCDVRKIATILMSSAHDMPMTIILSIYPSIHLSIYLSI